MNNDTWINKGRYSDRSPSRGIGRAVATRLARDGFAVTMNFAGHTAKAEEVVAKTKAAGGQAISVQADVSNIANVERLFKESMDAFGELV